MSPRSCCDNDGSSQTETSSETTNVDPITSTTQSSTVHLGECGDGVIDLDEECDDGENNSNESKCKADCSVAQCGDGFTLPSEEACDDGSESQDCNADCTISACGDGILNATANEECDDSNSIDSDGCDRNCRHSPLGLLSSSGSHVCARFPDGSARCWGAGVFGELGYGDSGYDVCVIETMAISPCSSLPTCCIGDDELAGSADPIDLNNKIVQISAGVNHTCSVIEGGEVYCWGRNFSGELGYGNIEDIGDNELPGSAGPVALGGQAKQISAGEAHTCAVLTDNRVLCWGASSDGRLGYGTLENIGDNPGEMPPPEVELAGPVDSVSAGGSHSCAVLKSGDVQCWGAGFYGQLGYGDTQSVGDDEAPNTAGIVDIGGKAIQISAGSEHTCALLDDRRVRCWGRGDFGQLGYGDEENIGDDETPGSASTLSLGGHAVQVVAGSHHTCALLLGGSVRCWGAGYGGWLGLGNMLDLGDDERPDSAAPINLGERALQIADGCALVEGSKVLCWGPGSAGRLGHGDIPGDTCLEELQEDVFIFSCDVDSRCCIGDELGEMPPSPIIFEFDQ